MHFDKAHHKALTFTGFSWLGFVLIAGVHCYLHGVVADGDPDLLFSFGWSFKSWLLWFLFIPFVYQHACKLTKDKNKLNKHLISNLKLGLSLCALSIGIKLISAWIQGENLLEELYYYTPREAAAFIMVSLSAHWAVFKQWLHNPEVADTSVNLTAQAQTSSRQEKDVFMVSKGQNQVMLRKKDIEWVIACGNYVEVYSLGEKYLTRATMKKLEQQLGGEEFLRIHRSYIVNKSSIKSVKKLKDCQAITTNCGQQLPLGKTYQKQLSHQLSCTIH